MSYEFDFADVFAAWPELVQGLVNSLVLSALAMVIGVGFVLVQTGAAPVGLVTAAAVYLVTLFWPMMAVIFNLDEVQSALASLARMVGVITSIDPAVSPGTEFATNTRLLPRKLPARPGRRMSSTRRPRDSANRSTASPTSGAKVSPENGSRPHPDSFSMHSQPVSVVAVSLKKK